VLAVAGGCQRATPPPTARHLVLVTIDTLRADHVGVYGARDVAQDGASMELNAPRRFPRLDGRA